MGCQLPTSTGARRISGCHQPYRGILHPKFSPILPDVSRSQPVSLNLIASLGKQRCVEPGHGPGVWWNQMFKRRPTNKKYIPYHPCVWYVYLHVVNLYGKCMQMLAKLPSSWWLQPIWKILVKIGIFPWVRGENKKYLKPPPRKFSRRKTLQHGFLNRFTFTKMGKQHHACEQLI